jgi:hypothetical protein
LAVAGCGAKSSTASSDGSATTTSAKATATTAAGAGFKVDLILSGEDPAVIRGTKGRCNIYTGPDAPASSGYEFLAADYPSLGPGGYLSFEGTHVNGVGAQQPAGLYKTNVNGHELVNAGPAGAGVTMSADRKHLIVDLDVARASGTPTPPITGHIKGSIDCG